MLDLKEIPDALPQLTLSERWRLLRLRTGERKARVGKWLRSRLAYRFARIDIDAKCPGCGHRRGFIKMDEERRQIVHVCLICQARWGERCVAHVDSWLPRN